MSNKEKQIMQTFEKVIPRLSPEDKAYLLGFGEGLAATVQAKDNDPKAEEA